MSKDEDEDEMRQENEREWSLLYFLQVFDVQAGPPFTNRHWKVG